MKRLLSRHLRRSPRARLQIEPNKGTPPGYTPGGVIVTVTVCPDEPFVLGRGLLELLLSTTHFSRTTLDGYREHTAEEVWCMVELFENIQAGPGDVLVRTTKLQLPQAPASQSRPSRLRWQARVIIEPEGRARFWATTDLDDATPAKSGPPVVDGTGFLPLYEFRAGPGS